MPLILRRSGGVRLILPNMVEALKISALLPSMRMGKGRYTGPAYPVNRRPIRELDTAIEQGPEWSAFRVALCRLAALSVRR